MWAWRTGAGSAGCATEIGEYPLKTPMGFTIGTQSTKGNGQADCPAKGIYECPAKGCTYTHTHREMQLCGPAKGAQACLGTQKGEGKTILAHIGKA